MAPRKRKAAPTRAASAPMIVNFHAPANVNFAAPAVAAAAPEAPEPGRWLPPPPSRDSRVSQTLGGGLRIQCNSCHRRKCHRTTYRPEEFVPVKNPRDAAAYTKAVAAIGEARAAKDGAAYLPARETIETLATARCAPCRASNAKSTVKPTTKTGACRAEWKRLETEDFHECGVCGATRAVEANHGATYAANAEAHTEMKDAHGQEAADAAYPAAERKIEAVSDYKYWAFNGGVPAMRAEAAKCAPLCRMCHRLDPSSDSAPVNAGSRAKAAAKPYDTEEERQKAVRHAGYREDKRNFVNKLKCEVGVCERPDCPRDGPSDGQCVEGYEACSDWDHKDPATKGRAIGAIVADHRPLATSKPEIFREIGLPPNFNVDTDPTPPVAERRCRLLCANCHTTRDEWDTAV